MIRIGQNLSTAIFERTKRRAHIWLPIIFMVSIIIYMITLAYSPISAYTNVALKYQTTPSPPNCSTLKLPEFLNNTGHRETALASFPGSGNTFARILISIGTGVKTGDIYSDKSLQNPGFAASIADNSVAVFKTHWPRTQEAWVNGKAIEEKYTLLPRAVVLIRHPRDAIIADYTRLKKNSHTVGVGIGAFRTNDSIKGDWEKEYMQQLDVWYSFHIFWFTKYKGQLHVAYYENLQASCEIELKAIIQFIELEPVDCSKRVKCACLNAESFHRSKHHPIEEITNDAMKIATNQTIYKLKQTMHASSGQNEHQFLLDTYITNDIWHS